MYVYWIVQQQLLWRYMQIVVVGPMLLCLLTGIVMLFCLLIVCFVLWIYYATVNVVFYILTMSIIACLFIYLLYTVFVIFKWRKKKSKQHFLSLSCTCPHWGVVMLKKLRCRRLARAPNVNHATEIEHYINNILHRSERHCVSQIRMKPIVFHKLCNILTERELIWQTAYMSIRSK